MYCPKCGASVAAGLTYCATCGANLQSSAPPQSPSPSPVYAAPAYGVPPQPVQRVWDYATWSTRAIGYIIDALLIGLGMAILYLVVGALFASMFHLADWTGGGGHWGAAPRGFCCMWIVLFPLATLFVGLYNSVFLIAQRGYSIGQGVVRVMVVDANGNLLTTGSAFIRLLVRVAFGFVPFLPALDLLWPLWDVRRQTLHDKAVNCYVINMR
jgi:uncharacterized RDD family membrane protein YckC